MNKQFSPTLPMFCFITCNKVVRTSRTCRNRCFVSFIFLFSFFYALPMLLAWNFVSLWLCSCLQKRPILITRYITPRFCYVILLLIPCSGFLMWPLLPLYCIERLHNESHSVHAHFPNQRFAEVVVFFNSITTCIYIVRQRKSFQKLQPVNRKSSVIRAKKKIHGSIYTAQPPY